MFVDTVLVGLGLPGEAEWEDLGKVRTDDGDNSSLDGYAYTEALGSGERTAPIAVRSFFLPNGYAFPPSGRITGIGITIRRRAMEHADGIGHAYIRLKDDKGRKSENLKQDTMWSTEEAALEYGGPDEKWGGSAQLGWTDFREGNFELEYAVQNFSTDKTITPLVDQIKATIYFDDVRCE